MAGNPKNMKPPRTKEEAKRRGTQGGIKSGEARRAKRTLREHMQALLESTIKSKNGEKLTGAEAMAIRAFQSALKGDWKAWELARDTSGQKCVEKVILASVDLDTIKEVEDMVLGE